MVKVISTESASTQAIPFASACSLKSLATSFVFQSQLQMGVVLPSVWWLPRQTGWNSTGTFKLFAGFAICQWLPGSAGQPACSKGIQVP
jgi:hypothetical protein